MMIDEAIAKIEDGRTEDAIVVLEMLARPKFNSVVKAKSAYAGAMSRKKAE